MLKKCFILFIIPLMLSAGVIRKDYYFDTPRIKDGIVYMEGCRITREAFAPSVAVKPVKLLLSRGQKGVSFDVNYDDPVFLGGEYDLNPFRPGGRITANPPADYLTRRSTAYSIDNFYPAAVRSERFSTQYKNGHAIFVTIINPVQYNPVTGKIKYFKRISVTVHTEATRAPEYKCTPLIKGQLKLLVDNPEAVTGLPYSQKAADDYEYLIVTPDALGDSWGSFVEFNERRCLRTKITTLSDIRSNMTGVDDADKIRNYIKQEYIDHNIVYVLLGGDDDNTNADDISKRGMRSEVYDFGTDYYDDKDIAADMYYSCLDGDWLDTNQYYGEPGTEDIGWEVYTARFPVDNTAELNNIINKTIKYSEAPVGNEVVNNLLAGEYLWGPPSHPVECWGKPLMLQFVGECTDNGFTTNGFDNNWNTSQLYEKDASWSKSDFINTVNNDKITWIDHIGTSNISYVMKCYSNDVTNSNFTNDGTNANYFIVYTQSCFSASFDNKLPGGSYQTDDCIGESFTSGISNAAVAYIGCSRYVFADDGTASADGTDGSNQRLHRYFHDAIFNKKIHCLEMMNAYSKEINTDLICIPGSEIGNPPYFGQMKWACYNLNILGDPALSIWTATPGNLAANYPSPLTTTTFSWNLGYPYTWVALVAGTTDSIICTQLTDLTGNCVINDPALAAYVNANPNGSLKVRAKAHNFYPFEGNLPIGRVTLTAPNGGEQWEKVKSYDISWTHNITGNIRIELLENNILLDTIALSVSSTSPYSWTVPNTLTPGTDYAIRLTSIDFPTISDESDAAFTIKSAGVAPTITSAFEDDTVVILGETFTIAGAAAGNPVPTYEWFYKKTPASFPGSPIDTDSIVTLTGAAKSDSGYYYFTATNTEGSKNSDTVCIHVVKPVGITLDLTPTTTVGQGGTATFSIQVDGDGVFSYQWYENGAIMNGDTGSSLTISPVDTALHDGNTYYCKVSNTFLGKPVGTATSKTSTIVVSMYYNPFKVKAERVDPHNTTQVKLSLWSGVDISTFPSTPSGTEPWADSVWVMYKTNGYTTNQSDAAIKHYSIAEVKNAAPDTVVSTIDVAPLQTPHDSSYWFNYSVLWHNTGSGDLLLEPFAEANKLFMFDTEIPENNLTVTGTYITGTDSAQLTVGNTSSLDATWDSIVTLKGSNFPGMSPPLWDVVFSIAVLQSGGDTYSLKVKVGDAPFESKTVYSQWFVTGKNTIESTKKTMQFLAGQPHPEYTGTLVAGTTLPDQVFLSWDLPDTGTDTVRVWWDTTAIPLDFNITLSANQAVYISPSKTLDTVTNLNPETVYYFGLQICRDQMWSYVTDKSSDFAKTLQADTTLNVTNTIAIATIIFDSVANAISISWSVDTTGITSDTTVLQWGYSYSMDSVSCMTAQPTQWLEVTGVTGVCSIPLGSNIVFDTTYYAGMWLRKKKLSGGVGVAAKPTSTSFSSIKTPATFTWQEITLSNTKLDTVYVMNGKIIIQSLEQFNFTDTIKAYTRPVALPSGLVSVGGVAFRFSGTNPQVPPFKLGMRFDSLRTTITEKDIGLYQDTNSMIHVFSDFEIQNGVVWATITSTDMAYPFLVLADTVAPVVSFEGLSDTSTVLNLGDAVTVAFSVQDNIANVEWYCKYGMGNDAYKFQFNGYTDSYLDTLSETMYTTSGSEDYGVRAIVITSDGIHTDTTNISRRVNTSNSDSLVAAAKTWAPLRATATLTDPGLKTVLSAFNNTQGIWEYDKTKFRVIRWYDPSGGAKDTLVEYSATLADDFSLVPGRVIWLKSKEYSTINFGAGVTTSLRGVSQITLQPNAWTDIALPFKFPVKLKDILAATGTVSDSLVFFHWVQSPPSYLAVQTYIPALDSVSGKLDTATLTYDPLDDAYTVYNYCSHPVTLQIPPIPPVLSQSRAAPKAARDIWDIQLVWKTAGSKRVNMVRCGCDNSGVGNPLIGPLAPSFNRVGVGVCDGKGSVGSYAVQHRVTKGGLSYEVVFYNQSGTAEEVEYFLDNQEALPDGFLARIYNPVSEKYEDVAKETAGITLESGKSDRRWVVVGNEAYFDMFLKQKVIGSFALLGMYPNPFRGQVHIRYIVPWHGVKKITFQVFDLRGRTVWQKEITRGIEPGVNSVIWKTNGNNGNHIASGVYLFRMNVYENGKKKPKVFNRKLTCLR